jgi:hypothetical protein
MKKFLLLIVFSLTVFQPGFTQIEFENPRIGIVISKTSFIHHWGITQMSAHGWGGVVNLAGIPYDCLFIEDISPERDLKKYDCLIISQCSYLTDSVYNQFLEVIEKYLNEKGNLILDGPPGHFDENTKQRDHSALDKLLNIKSSGFFGGPDYRIKVRSNDHFITSNFARDEFITQHIVGGLNIQSFDKDGIVLLDLTDENNSYPFLSINKTSNNRIVLVNDFATWSGVASIFRNVHPQVFYKNQVYNVLIEAVYWTTYGSTLEPIPSLQLSNADLTAIVRLDADASGNLNAQIQTINYLIDLAKETGVVPLYAWVSSTATRAGWQDLAPLGKKLESVGGQIGTHSRFHNIDQNMNEQRWKEELDDAIHEIEFNMADYGYDIGKVNCFINPGNTIYMSDYNQVAKRFDFYMTHGFEQDMPIGFGNFTWFNEEYKNFVVLENTPSPDYQWFYDPTWSYTTQQITAYEENIFDHLYYNIQRGVIFNQMWHDYSITSQPQYGKDRIVNTNNIAMYDAIKAKFKNSDIYTPDPEDLKYKLCIMAQSDYNWSVKGNEINVELDISNVGLDSAFLFTGGMGIRINNSNKKINKVFIDGEEHYAFNDEVVILPNLSSTSANIRILLSDETSVESHLKYISNRMTSVKKNKDGLSINVLSKSRAKLKFKTSGICLPLNADGFDYNKRNNEIECYAAADRLIQLKKLSTKGIEFLSSNIRIEGISESQNKISLRVTQQVPEITNQIKFSPVQKINSIMLDNKEINFQQEGENCIINIDPFEGKKELTINLK